MPAAISAFARAAQKAGIIEETPGKTLVRSMRDAMAEGKLIAEELLPYVAEELWEVANAGGALDDAMNSTAAAIGRFQTNLWLANKTMNEAGLDVGVRRFMNATSEAIYRSDGLWKVIGNMFEWLMRSLGAPMELLGAIGSRLGQASDALEPFGLRITDLVAALLLFFRAGRVVLGTIFVVMGGFSALGKVIDGETLSWLDWIVLIGMAILGFKGLSAAINGVARAKQGLGNLGRIFGGGGARPSPRTPTTTPPASIPRPQSPAEKLRERVQRMNESRAQTGSSSTSTSFPKRALGRILGPIGVGLGIREIQQEISNSGFADIIRYLRDPVGNYPDLFGAHYPDIGRLNAMTVQEQERARQMIVHGGITFNIEGHDGPQIADDVIRIINEQLIRPASTSDPVLEQ